MSWNTHPENGGVITRWENFATQTYQYAYSAVLKHVLIQRALHDEATHFWERRARDPAAPMPDTFNMSGYLVPASDPAQLPPPIRPLAPGFHSLPRAQGGSLVPARTPTWLIAHNRKGKP